MGTEAVVAHDQQYCVVVALLARRIPLERARELAQEAWTKLMERQQDGGLARIELPGLVIRQAFFLEQDRVRAERVRASASVTELAAAPELAASPEGRVMSRQLLARAREALARRPRHNRQIFELCYGDPTLSHAEAAQRLGVTIQHVRQTLYEVRRELRRLLEDGHD